MKQYFRTMKEMAQFIYKDLTKEEKAWIRKNACLKNKDKIEYIVFVGSQDNEDDSIDTAPARLSGWLYEMWDKGFEFVWFEL